MLGRFTNTGRTAVRRSLDAHARRQNMGVLSPLLGSDPNQNALNEAMPGTPLPTAPNNALSAPTLQTLTTDSGLTIISEQSNSPLATVSVVIGVGSRDTNAAGVHMALAQGLFRNTLDSSALMIQRRLDEIGATVDTSVDRENIRVTASTSPSHFNELVSIVGESISQPVQWFDLDWKSYVHYVNLALEDGNVGTARLSDAIHAAAYYDNLTLGIPVYGTPLADADAPRHLAISSLVASNTTVVVTGPDHGDAEKGVRDSFSDMREGTFSRAASEYVGGESRVGGASGSADCVVALNAAGSSPAAAQVLAAVLGSASATSGGRHHQIGAQASGRAAQALESNDGLGNISAFAETHSDGGLIGAHASSNADSVADTYGVLVNFLKAGGVTDNEVAHAKQFLDGQARAQQDSQLGRARVLGEQAANKGFASRDAIAAVTTADVKAALDSALKSEPSFATVGDLSSTPRYNKLKALF